MLPYGASLDQVGDCFEAVRHTLLQLVIKLFEAEDLQLIARLDLADGDGEEALVNVVVAGLKAMNVSRRIFVTHCVTFVAISFLSLAASWSWKLDEHSFFRTLTSTNMGQSERHSAHTSCSASAWKRWTPLPMCHLALSIVGFRFTSLSCPRQKRLSFCEEGFVKPSTKTSGVLA